MIQHLPRLKQLDESEISTKEKRDAGIMVDSDEEGDEASDEDREEEDEISEGSKSESKLGSDLFVPLAAEAEHELSSTSSYKQLPKIESMVLFCIICSTLYNKNPIEIFNFSSSYLREKLLKSTCLHFNGCMNTLLVFGLPGIPYTLCVAFTFFNMHLNNREKKKKFHPFIILRCIIRSRGIHC